MNLTSAIVLLLFLLVIALGIYGIFRSRRSILIGLSSLVLATLAGLGSWYSFAESHSLPWTIGYAILALVGTVSAFRNLAPGHRDPDRSKLPT